MFIIIIIIITITMITTTTTTSTTTSCYCCCCCCAVKVAKSRQWNEQNKYKWVKRINVHNIILVVKPHGKRLFVRPKHRWQDNIKQDKIFFGLINPGGLFSSCGKTSNKWLGFNKFYIGCSELSSGLYCRVKWLSTDVSEVRTASIIRDEWVLEISHIYIGSWQNPT
jgi:hypothetical protein